MAAQIGTDQYDTLEAAWAAAIQMEPSEGSPTVIEILKDCELTEGLLISKDNRYITLCSGTAGPYTILRGYDNASQAFIYSSNSISSGSSETGKNFHLTLEDIILDGNKEMYQNQAKNVLCLSQDRNSLYVAPDHYSVMIVIRNSNGTTLYSDLGQSAKPGKEFVSFKDNYETTVLTLSGVTAGVTLTATLVSVQQHNYLQRRYGRRYADSNRAGQPSLPRSIPA